MIQTLLRFLTVGGGCFFAITYFIRHLELHRAVKDLWRAYHQGHGGHGAFISLFTQHQAAPGTPLGSHLAALLQVSVLPFQV